MVAPLEQAAANAFINNVMGKLFEVLGLVETYTMLRDLKKESISLQEDLRMLAAAVDDEVKKSSRGASRTAIARERSDAMRNLMHDIEDCIERFAHRVTCNEGAWWLSRVAHGVRTIGPCYQFAAEIQVLKKRVNAEKDRVLTPLQGEGISRRAGADLAARYPVGIEKPMEELLALLDLDLDHVEGQPQPPAQAQPRVVPIVGFGGVGRTTLAWKAYHAPAVAMAFPCRAWVDGSLKNGDAAEILEDIHQQLLPGQKYSKTSLTKYLKDRRYLIVIDDIDDIDEEQWDTIASAFNGSGEGSRILVTTTFQSRANRRSDGNGHVYKMRTLKRTDSMRVALQERCAAELVQGSTMLLDKCDGLPLALVSVARQLSSENEPTGAFCQQLCNKLGSYLDREDGEPNFARLRQVLMDNYASLSNFTVRTCLLYLSIFPTVRPLRKNVIIRRWLAEGYARSEDIALTEQSVANENFNEFIDRHIIHPVDTRNNAEVKTCKTHGIMHEFLLQRSMREKFIMCSLAARDKIVRHLFVDGDVGNDTNSSTNLNMDLSRVRSLTVRGSGGCTISNFGKYKLMRVLDLEECTDVNDRHVKKICKLWNLRYLSLGPKCTELPKDIARLKLLQTLAVNKTAVTVLPVEIIGLSCLIHLIGKFKLLDQDETSSSKLEQLSKKSKLETLAGFVADGSQGFLQVMVHMKKLRKVKIWCESTEDINNLENGLSEATRQYIKAPMGADQVRSLSIDFQELPDGSLHAPRDLCNDGRPSQQYNYLSSLKLHGDLSTWHDFIAILSDLKKVCLTSIIVAPDLLLALSKITTLLYLELIAHEIGSFVVKVGTFRSLRRLRFVVQHQNLVLPEIEESALPELVSLHLVCKHLAGPSDIVIRKLNKLQEIGLHPEVSEAAREEWEAAARNHPNRPSILPFLSVEDPVGDELTDNPVQQQAADEAHGRVQEPENLNVSLRRMQQLAGNSTLKCRWPRRFWRRRAKSSCKTVAWE